MPVPPSSGRPLRLTVWPQEDVLVRHGATVGELRRPLAELTGRPELGTAPLTVDGIAVDDEHRCGQPPLTAGAELRTAGGPAVGRQLLAGAVRRAVRTPWHLAAVSGPRSGWILPLDSSGVIATDGRTVDVQAGHGAVGGGRDGGPADGEDLGRLPVLLSVSTTRVRVRASSSGPEVACVRAGPEPRPGAPEGGGPPSRRGVLPRTRPRVDSPFVGFPGAPRRVSRRRWTRLRPGDLLLVDGSELLLRGPLGSDVPPRGATDVRAADDGPGRRLLAPALLGAAAPLAGTLALTLGTGRAALAIPALLTGALVAAGAVRRAAGRDRRPATVEASAGPPLPTDLLGGAVPAALLWNIVGPASAGPMSTGPASPVPMSPVPMSTVPMSTVPAPTQQGPTMPGLPRCLAVTGPRERALATARAMVADAAGRGAAIAVAHGPADDRLWRWCRWLPDAIRVDPDGRPLDDLLDTPGSDGRSSPGGGRLVVVDRGRVHGWLPEVGHWWMRTDGGSRLLLIEDEPGGVPTWCPEVLDHSEDGRVELRDPDRRRPLRSWPGVDAEWAEGLGRLLATGEAAPGGDTVIDRRSAAPRPCSLLEALQASDTPDLAAWIRERWERPPAGLTAPLGLRTDGGRLDLDLTTQGPHLLVGGTTGAGKSDLLQTLLLGWASSHPPAELSMALIDYKGGASFGRCVDLPHVTGLVTDLDPALTERALQGLGAELRRRKLALERSASTSYEEHRASGAAMPRLLVVVDEFRALADELPGFLPGLMRLAAQGRSLGMHLVLATQRPSGAVNAEIRANVSARIALRVTDDADSTDIVGVPDASALPATAPGRALLRCGAEPPVLFQAAWAHGEPERSAAARRAPRWGAEPRRGLPSERPPADAALRLVTAAGDAARDLPRADPPWTPPLPERVDASPWRRPPGPAASSAVLPLALADLVDERRQVLAAWDLRRPLVLGGRAGSGRTTALTALAGQAWSRGMTVHLLGDEGPLADHVRHGAPDGRAGTVARLDDPARIARFLRLLCEAGKHDRCRRSPRDLVMVDDVEQVQRALDRLPRGLGADLLSEALRRGPAAGACLALATGLPVPGGLARLGGPRLTFVSADEHADLLVDVPRRFAGAGGLPGRAVWTGPAVLLTGSEMHAAGPPRSELEAGPAGPPTGTARSAHARPDLAALCQVGRDGPDLGRPATPTAPRTGHSALLLRELPARVRLADLLERRERHEPRTPQTRERVESGPGTGPMPRSAGGGVLIGVGEHDSAPVTLPIEGGALICGVRGSGRSTLLRLIVRQLDRDLTEPLLLTHDSPLLDLGEEPGLTVLDVGPEADAARGLRAWADRAKVWTGAQARRPVLLVDDVDDLTTTSPQVADELSRLQASRRVDLVVTATVDRAATAYRGVLAPLRAQGTGVLLSPGAPGAGEVLGLETAWFAGAPGSSTGRGVVVSGGRTQLVQVAEA